MTRLALALLVATGLVAALALDRRARREPGSRLPWVFMSVAVAVDALVTLTRAVLGRHRQQPVVDDAHHGPRA